MSEECEGILKGFGGKVGKMRRSGGKGRQGFGRIGVEFQGIRINLG